ncbi:MAG: hypothetical protein ACE5D2_05955 [Fidelibacterota bacterium]
MPSPHNSPGYEQKDVKVKAIFWVLIASILITTAFFFLSREYFLSTKNQLVYEMVIKPKSAKLVKLKKHEEEILSSYGVVDADKGIYRIPITQAIELLAAESNNLNGNKKGTQGRGKH